MRGFREEWLNDWKCWGITAKKKKKIWKISSHPLWKRGQVEKDFVKLLIVKGQPKLFSSPLSSTKPAVHSDFKDRNFGNNKNTLNQMNGEDLKQKSVLYLCWHRGTQALSSVECCLGPAMYTSNAFIEDTSLTHETKRRVGHWSQCSAPLISAI